MAKTIRDIPVYNRTVPEVMNEIMAWVNAHKIKIEENRGTYLKVKLKKTLSSAGLFVEAPKIIEINVQQTPNGIVVHTEGFVKLPFGGGEKDFSANAMNARAPRKEGWRAIEDLWQRLSILSGATTQHMPNAPPPPPPQYQQPQSPEQKDYPPPPPPQAKAKSRRQETQTPSKIPKFCPFCGTSLGERAEKIKFCPNCGEKIV